MLSENLEEVNTSSGDSLNELSLGLSDTNDDNEKLLANILEECQMEDSKVLSQTSIFWNGLLEDNALQNLDALEDATNEPKIDRTIGYSSDVISTCSRRASKESSSSLKSGAHSRSNHHLYRSTRTGQSHFKVTSQQALARHARQQILMAAAAAAAAGTPNTTLKQEEVTTTSIHIKTEPQDDVQARAVNVPLGTMATISRAGAAAAATTTTSVVLVQQGGSGGTPLQLSTTAVHIKPEHQISSADATASHDYAAVPTANFHPMTQLQAGQHHQLVQIIGAAQNATAIRTPQHKMQAFATGDATAVFPTVSTTTMRQINGPAGK